MGLDQTLTLVKSFWYGGRDGEPTTLVDGFPLVEQRMEVVDWRKHIWAHQFFCERHSEANECQDVVICTDELKLFADKLEQWIDDPEVLPPIDDKFRGPFFGVRESDEDYEESRDYYRAMAKDDVKAIRKAIEWIKRRPPPVIRSPPVTNEFRSAIYKVSW
tara:strand:- start:1341 stop:1823 length:483 start_codon:yes stop_codon:yes gene_type:complete